MVALHVEEAVGMTWRPNTCVEILSNVGMELQCRCECENPIRAYAVHITVHRGVNKSQT